MAIIGIIVCLCGAVYATWKLTSFKSTKNNAIDVEKRITQWYLDKDKRQYEADYQQALFELDRQYPSSTQALPYDQAKKFQGTLNSLTQQVYRNNEAIVNGNFPSQKQLIEQLKFGGYIAHYGT